MSEGASARIGRWLFVNRGWAPVPVLVAQLALGTPTPAGWAAGLALVALGEATRMWGVGHIGPRSRTRGDDTWGLVDTGPYGRVRNPLYLGNILMFTGLGAICGPLWGGIWCLALCTHYAFIVRWEESNLRQKLGAPYAEYLQRVPRWLPLGPGREGGSWDGGAALKSERSTLIAAAAVVGALALKAVFF